MFGVSDFATSEPLINAEKIVGSGLDFIEPGLAKVAAMSEEDFEAAAQRIESGKIRVQSMNWFLPPALKVVGSETDAAAQRSFLEGAFSRAARLGARAIVLGSPGSRSIPEGFSADEARVQMVEFLRLAAEVIRGKGSAISVALEHVNHTETNFLNTFAQAHSLAREVDRAEIGLAADFYHFEMENESVEAMKDAADLICAVQIANPNGRCFPTLDAEMPRVDRFFEVLSEIGYAGGISVEATPSEDLEADCRRAAEFFKYHSR
ncbi:MAG: sugar phosphate isomerase/epimerase family protein [Akkermansiaceae bacterium]